MDILIWILASTGSMAMGYIIIKVVAIMNMPAEEFIEKYASENRKFQKELEVMMKETSGAIAVLESGDVIKIQEPKELDDGEDYIEKLLFEARKSKGEIPDYITTPDECRAYDAYKRGEIGIEGLKHMVVSMRALRRR